MNEPQRFATLHASADGLAVLPHHMRNNIEQAVLVAFADEAGRSEEDLLRLGSGFGSGMGTMEGTCGALVGAIMVSSLLSEKGPRRR